MILKKTTKRAMRKLYIDTVFTVEGYLEIR